MKKFIAGILAAAIMGSCTAIAAEAKEIKCLKSEEEYDYGADYIVRDAETGEIIPLSQGPMQGYSYAYTDGNFTVEKIEDYEADFTDLNEWQRLDLYIRTVSVSGIMTGFPDGTFRPERELTRAETAVIFARLFGLKESGEGSGFSDISDGDWYSGSAAALKEAGVLKEDALFRPNAPVTREELITMTMRMLQNIDMLPENDGDLAKYEDSDEVSEWAREAYAALSGEYYNIMAELIDNDFEDLADDEYYLKPKEHVTRALCAEYLHDFIRCFLESNAPAIRRDSAPGVEIPILDGSTSTYDITANIYSAYYLNCDKAEGFPRAHSKTTNSYKRLIDGEVDMIFVPDAGETVREYAKEKGVELRFIPIANEALVFFTASDERASGVTTEALRKIYADNSIVSWSELGGDDKGLVAYCRNDDSGSHAQMENFILDGSEINEEIRRERMSVMMSSILTETDEFNKANEDKRAIGYSLYYYFTHAQYVLGAVDLKLLAVDGVIPTDETISNGTYPYTTNYYAVVRAGEENDELEKFIELMMGEFGREIVEQSGLGSIAADGGTSD